MTRIYVASKVKHAPMWRCARDKEGIAICSRWIDVDEDKLEDFGRLWSHIQEDVREASRLVLFVEADDFPLKGALVEVGMALAYGVPVFVVLDPDLELEGKTQRPVGSWLMHPLVKVVPTLHDAFTAAPSTWKPKSLGELQRQRNNWNRVIRFQKYVNDLVADSVPCAYFVAAAGGNKYGPALRKRDTEELLFWDESDLYATKEEAEARAGEIKRRGLVVETSA